MKKTVLKYVQNILSAMDSDNVNSIHDTVESYQVANALQTIFEQIVDEYDIPAIHTEYQLEGGTDTDEPTRLEIPDEFMTCEWIKYDVRNNLTDSPAYSTIPRIDPEQFINRQANLNTDPTLYKQVTLESGVKIRVRTDHAPTCWTSFNNKTIIFDGYNKSVESTVMAAKTICYGQKKKEIILEDTHEVDLPKELSLLLELNTLEYSYDLWKGSTPAKIVHLARKARVRAQRSDNKFRDEFSTGPDYGRTSTGRKKPKSWGAGGSSSGGAVEPPVEPPPTSSGGVVSFVTSSYTVNENGQLQVQLQRIGGTSGELIVRVTSTPALTNPSSGLVSWADTVGGVASLILQTLPISQDTTINLSLSVVSGTGILSTTTSIPVNITNTDLVNPGVINSSISAIIIPEGSTFTFTLTRDGGVDGEATCPWGVEDGTASLLTPNSGTAVWLDGESAPITYTITAGSVINGQSLIFGRGTPTGAISGGSAPLYSLSITNVASPGVMQFSSVTPISIDEATSTNVVFTRTGGSEGIVSLRYLVENNLAVPSVGRVEWQNGDSADKTVSITATNVSGTQTSRIVLDDARGGATIGANSERSFTVVDKLQGFVNLQFSPITAPEATQITVQAARYGGKDGAVTVPYTVNGSLATPSTGSFEWDDQVDGIAEVILNTAAVAVDTTNTIVLGTPTGGLQLGSQTQINLTVEDIDTGVLNMSALPADVDEGSTITLTVTRDNGSQGAASCDWVFPGFSPSYGSFTWADGNADNKTATLTALPIYQSEDQTMRYGHLLNITGAGNGGTIRRNIPINWVSSTKSMTNLTVVDASNDETRLGGITPILPGAAKKVVILMDWLFPAEQEALSVELAYLPNQAHLNALGTILETDGITEVILDIEHSTDNPRTEKWDYWSTDQTTVEGCATLWLELIGYIRETYTGDIGIYDGVPGVYDYAGTITNPAYNLVTATSRALFVAQKYQRIVDAIVWMEPVFDEVDFLVPSVYGEAFCPYNTHNTGHWNVTTGVPETGYTGPYWWTRSIADTKVVDTLRYRTIHQILEAKWASKKRVWFITNKISSAAKDDIPATILEWQMNELEQYTGDEIGIWSYAAWNEPWPAEDIQEYTNYTGNGFGTINIAVNATSVNENTNNAITLTITRDGGSLGAATSNIGVLVGGNLITPAWWLEAFSWINGNDDTFTRQFTTNTLTSDSSVTFAMGPTTGATKGTPDSRTVTILNVPLRGTLNLTNPTAISGNELTTQTFTVLRTGGSEGEVGCTWTIARASGVQLVDVETGTITFADGVTSQTVSVTLSNVGTTVPAGNYLTISAATGGAALGATTTGTVSVTAIAAIGHGILNLETTAPTGTVGGTFDIRVGRDNTSGAYTATTIPWTLSGSVGTPVSGTFSWGASPDNADKTQTITCTNAGTGSILLGTPTGSAIRGVYQGTATVSNVSTVYDLARVNTRFPNLSSLFTGAGSIAYAQPAPPVNPTRVINVTADGAQVTDALAANNATINVAALPGGATYATVFNIRGQDQIWNIAPGCRIQTIRTDGGGSGPATARRIIIRAVDPRNMWTSKIWFANQESAAPEDILWDGIFCEYKGLNGSFFQGRRIAILNSHIRGGGGFTLYSGWGADGINTTTYSQNNLIANSHIENWSGALEPILEPGATPGSNFIDTGAVRLYKQQNFVVVDSRLSQTAPDNYQSMLRLCTAANCWYIAKNELSGSPPTIEYWNTGTSPNGYYWYLNNRLYISSWNKSGSFVTNSTSSTDGTNNANFTNVTITGNTITGRAQYITSFNSPYPGNWVISGNSLTTIDRPETALRVDATQRVQGAFDFNKWQTT